MAGQRNGAKQSPMRIAGEIRTELHTILRGLCELMRPLHQFYTSPDRPVGVPRHFVTFDRSIHSGGTGLRIGALKVVLPVPSITERVGSLAVSIWHLKDRLNKYAKATGKKIDLDEWARREVNLLICADLTNYKKHAGNENQSRLNPRLNDVVEFDTSRSGCLEQCYNGAMKTGELLVTNKEPIPFWVNVLDGDSNVIGNAADILRSAFDHWLPVIDQLGVLDGAGREDEELRKVLFPRTENQGITKDAT